MTRRAEFVLALVAALVALTFVGNEVVPALVVGGIVVLCAAVILWGRVVSRRSGSGGPTSWLPEAFAAGWLMLSVVGTHAPGASSARTAGIGLVAIVQVMCFAVVAAFGILVVRAFVDDVKNTVVPAALLGLPVFATLSFLWTPDFTYAFGRGFQLVATAVFAWATIELGARSPQFLQTMVECFLRWLVWLTAFLVGVGVVFGGIYAPVGAQNLDRFFWIGAHPNLVGFITGIAVVALVGMPTGTLRLPLVGRGALLAVVSYGAYGAQARTSLVALGAGLGVLVVLFVMRSTWARYVSLPYVLAGVFAVTLIFRDQALGYFYRDQDADVVSSGNGRAELWGDAYGYLRTTFDWVFGLGYGQSETVFLAERSWATNAHSSVLGILVNLGIVGVALLAFWLFYTLFVVYRSQIFLTPLGRTLPAFLAFIIVHSIAAETTSTPAGGHALMMLVAAVSAAVVRLQLRRAPTVLGPSATDEDADDSTDGPAGSSDADGEPDDRGPAGATTSAASRAPERRRSEERVDAGLRVRLRTGQLRRFR